ncbi:hypothetical protein AND_009941 [Anopheles darlingi]|uniref:Uncharacterized protein n=1 Tax=Anopheles darlingi TaxID=43151 RepID=W5J4Z9_ANODA|nr:hypothetical protein AND_009941 [Anopheles darlingi]
MFCRLHIVFDDVDDQFCRASGLATPVRTIAAITGGGQEMRLPVGIRWDLLLNEANEPSPTPSPSPPSSAG